MTRLPFCQAECLSLAARLQKAQWYIAVCSAKGVPSQVFVNLAEQHVKALAEDSLKESCLGLGGDLKPYAEVDAFMDAMDYLQTCAQGFLPDCAVGPSLRGTNLRLKFRHMSESEAPAPTAQASTAPTPTSPALTAVCFFVCSFGC